MDSSLSGLAPLNSAGVNDRRNGAFLAIAGLAAAVALAAAVWLVAAAYLRQARTDAERVAAAERRNVALALASQVDAALAQTDDALLGMRRVWLENGDDAFRREDLARAAARRGGEVFEQFVLFDREGRIIYTTPKGYGAWALGADTEHFFVHRRDPLVDEPHFGRPFFGRLAGRWHMQITRPLIDSAGDFAGVIAASVRPERFAELHRGLELGPGGVIAIIRETGEYVARTDRHDEVVGRFSLIKPLSDLTGADHGEITVQPVVDGVERVYSWRKARGAPLYLLVGQPVAQIFGPVEALRRKVYFWLGGLTLVSGGLAAALAYAAAQRGRALAALRESESRFRGMFENSNAGIAFTGPGGRFIDANDAFLKMMRCSRGDLLEKTVADFTHPDDMAQEAPLFDQLLRGVRREYRLVKRCLPLGGGMMWLDVSVSAVRGDDGRARMLVGAVVDVTDLKANEAALAISNAELEQFGYVASHDLRQPLRMIISYLSLLEKRVGAELDGEASEFLNYARDGARRMEHMLASLLEYSRIGRHGEPMTLHDSRDALDEAMRYLGPDIEISGAKVTVSGDWPRIVASEDEMVRLFQNLLSNALKYRRPGAAPTVAVSVVLENGEWLFTVTDDGVGFPPDQTGRLFKVFQRLAGPDECEGTGVGLAVCRKIVERHGGKIWAESSGKGRGATFRFTLPTIQTGPRAA